MKFPLRFNDLAQQFARDEEGATAIEYGLFAALIAAVIVGSVSLLGSNVKTGFDSVNTALCATDAITCPTT